MQERPLSQRAIDTNKEPAHSAKINAEDLKLFLSLALKADRGFSEVSGIKGPNTDLHITAMRLAALGIGKIIKAGFNSQIILPNNIAYQLEKLRACRYITLSGNSDGSLASINITSRGENVLIRILTEVKGKKKFGDFIRNLQHEYEELIRSGHIGNNFGDNRNFTTSVFPHLGGKLFKSRDKVKFRALQEEANKKRLA